MWDSTPRSRGGRGVVALAAVATIAVGCSSGSGAPELAARPQQPVAIDAVMDIPYTSTQELDVFHPQEGGPWPVVVFFHGGNEPRSDSRFLARRVAEQGTVVVLPQYRATPAELELDFDGPLQDAACAMRFARARAGDYGGTAERVVAAGFSLGGNMAGVMAVGPGDGFVGDCVVGSEHNARADGLVGLDAVFDFETMLVEAGTPAGPETAIYNAFGYLDEAGFDDREPVPTAIFTGNVEELEDQAVRFRDALQSHGWEVAYTRTDVEHSIVFFGEPTQIDGIVAVAYDEPVSSEGT